LTLTVTESTFAANTTTGSGGGIESDSGTAITLQDDTIYGNTADYTGSGLDLEESSSAPIVENTVIAEMRRFKDRQTLIASVVQRRRRAEI